MIPSQKKWIALGIENLGRGGAEPPPFLLAKLTLSSRFSPQPIQTSKKRNTSKKTYCFYSIPVPKMCSSHFSLDRRPPAAEFPSARFSLGNASGAYAAPSVSAVFGRIFLCRKTSQKRNTNKKNDCVYSIPGPTRFSGDRYSNFSGRLDTQTFRAPRHSNFSGRLDIQTFRAPRYSNFSGAWISKLSGRPDIHVFRATDIQTSRGASIFKLFGRPDIQTFRGASILKLFGRPDIQTFRAPAYPNFFGALIFTFFGRPKFKLFGAPRSSNFSGAPIFKLFGAPRYSNLSGAPIFKLFGRLDIQTLWAPRYSRFSVDRNSNVSGRLDIQTFRGAVQSFLIGQAPPCGRISLSKIFSRQRLRSLRRPVRLGSFRQDFRLQKDLPKTKHE